MTYYLKVLLFAFICFVLAVPAIYAGEGSAAHGASAGHKSEQKAAEKKHSHHSAAHWAQTLSDEQKAEVDQLHLQLERDLVVLKAREVLKEKELNVLTASDGAKQADIYAKIDELMEVKKQIMRHRHDHLVEMRALLTPEQRVSYDMGVLGRSGVK